jgi:hypothetical protein
MSWLRRFGRFWYDFLVGDRWELFVGPLAALALAGVLVRAGMTGAGVGLVLFISVAAVGTVSIAAALRS